MKRAAKILMFLFILPSLLYSQSDNTKKLYSSDSLKIEINSNPLTEIQIKFDEFELYREFNNLKLNIPIDGDPQTVWLRTSLAVSNTNAQGSKTTPHYLSPLYAQYLEDSKFNP